MPALMKHATTKQRNAAFDAVYERIKERWLPVIPWPMNSKVTSIFNSPEGRTGVLELVDIALEASERAEE